MRAYDYLKYSSVVFETCYMHLSYMYRDSDIDAHVHVHINQGYSLIIVKITRMGVHDGGWQALNS